MSLRLFVAAELPDDVVDALVAWRPRADALRPVAREALHLTLAFLGWREESDARAVAAALRPLERPVGALSLAAARWLPPRRPRVLAVDVADGRGELAALQAAVVGALAEAVGFVPERRPFLAHVTVARVRSGAPAPRAELPDPPDLGFAASALTLFRSHLGSAGARYEPLAQVALD